MRESSRCSGWQRGAPSRNASCRAPSSALAAAPENPCRPDGSGCSRFVTPGRARLRQQHAAQEPALSALITENASGLRNAFLRERKQQMLCPGLRAAKFACQTRRTEEHPVQRRRVCRFFHFDRLLSEESFDAAGGVYTTLTKKSGRFEEFTLFSLHFQESMIE